MIYYSSAFITGATSGIGKAIKEALLKDKIEVWEVSRLVRAQRHSFKLDLSDRKSVRKFLKDEKFPWNCEILINNAGVCDLEEDNKHFDYYMNLHVWTPWMFMKTFLRNWKRWGGLRSEIAVKERESWGSPIIINIISEAAYKGSLDIPLYSMSKAALLNLTKSFAIKGSKLSPKIRVNSISPGIIDTNLVPGETPDFLIEGIPLKREGKASEVASIVKELIYNQYFTGADIRIDGGNSVL